MEVNRLSWEHYRKLLLGPGANPLLLLLSYQLTGYAEQLRWVVTGVRVSVEICSPFSLIYLQAESDGRLHRKTPIHYYLLGKNKPRWQLTIFIKITSSRDGWQRSRRGRLSRDSDSVLLVRISCTGQPILPSVWSKWYQTHLGSTKHWLVHRLASASHCIGQKRVQVASTTSRRCRNSLGIL